MKAVIVKKYGGPEVAQIAEVANPVITKPDHILIKVIASSVNSGDARLRRADPWFVRLVFGLRGPRKQILGLVFAGEVVAAGTGVTHYKVGDRVYGMNEHFMNAHAEYMLASKKTTMGIMPEGMSFAEAAALPFGGTTALHFLEGIDLNNKAVLINGVSGAVGLSFLQIAKARGALVTGVTSSENMEMVKGLGADRVIDYTAQPIDTLHEEFDLVIDCVNKIPLNQIERYVKRGGAMILLAGLIKEMWQSRSIKKGRAVIGTAKVTNEQFSVISELFVSGKLKPVIQKIFTIDEITEAYRIVDSGRKVGNIVLQIQ